jgi:hypothetical protein
MARPSDIARMNDMAVERDSYTRLLTEKSKYPLMKRVEIYHLTKSPPPDLKTE